MLRIAAPDRASLSIRWGRLPRALSFWGTSLFCVGLRLLGIAAGSHDATAVAGPRQLNSLTRLARTLPSGYRVYVDVEQFIAGSSIWPPAHMS